MIRSAISAPKVLSLGDECSDAGWGIDPKADLSAVLQLQIRHTDTEMVETPMMGGGGQFKASFIPLSENFIQP